jgi:microcystin-dependent protein
MATVTGLTAARMLEIEAASVVDGEVVNGNLILTKHDGNSINAGPVTGPQGPTGPTGPAGFSAIPGEVRLWPGGVLPNPASYGKWVWADGGVYPIATYPLAAGNIGSQWRTFAGASDPGGTNFRVPDMRGLVVAGMDAMPGGSRANRMTRAAAATLAARTGEETHGLSTTELARHNHGSVTIALGVIGFGVSGSISGSTDVLGSHVHPVPMYKTRNQTDGGYTNGATFKGLIVTSTPVNSDSFSYQADWAGAHGHSVGGSFSGSGSADQGSRSGSTADAGDGTGHENVQPTVFVPYIVCLSG